jgi:triosephosphate isomerase
MNLTRAEAFRLADTIADGVAADAPADVLICPPFPYLECVREAISERPVLLGAQDVHWEIKGAFTGEVSPPMLREFGCTHAILGHSERRHIMHEPDEWINRKLRLLHQHGMTPILCVGEKLDERQAGRTHQVLLGQLDAGLKDVSADLIAKTVIAYEPVWAIGTGVNATPEQAEEAHAFIRARLAEIAGKASAESVKILYGGSVTAENAAGLIAGPDVDGALVGGASLRADSFVRIVRSTAT